MSAKSHRAAVFIIVLGILGPQQRSCSNLNFLSFGDWGSGSDGQVRVANAMAGWSVSGHPLSFILSAGDNFYESGVRSINDPLWKSVYEDVYAAKLGVPFYAALGNHDHYGNVSAQVDKTSRYHDNDSVVAAASSSSNNNNIRGKRTPAFLPFPSFSLKKGKGWEMPEKFYSFIAELNNNEKDTLAVFVILDTWSIASARETKEQEKQLRWLHTTLQIASLNDKVAWIAVVGHYPIFSSGAHGRSGAMEHKVLPMLLQFEVDMYIAGHDHNLECLEVVSPSFSSSAYPSSQPLTLVVSGSGGKTRSFPWRRRDSHSVFSFDDFGFTAHSLSAKTLSTFFVNDKGHILYSKNQSRRARRHFYDPITQVQQLRESEAREAWVEWKWVAMLGMLCTVGIVAAVVWSLYFPHRRFGGFVMLPAVGRDLYARNACNMLEEG